MRYVIKNQLSGNPVGVSSNSLNRAQNWVRRKGDPSNNIIVDTELNAIWSFDPETRWTIDEDDELHEDVCTHPSSGCRCAADVKLWDTINKPYKE